MVDEHYHTVLLVFQRITTSTLQLLQNSKYTYRCLIEGQGVSGRWKKTTQLRVFLLSPSSLKHKVVLNTDSTPPVITPLLYPPVVNLGCKPPEDPSPRSETQGLCIRYSSFTNFCLFYFCPTDLRDYPDILQSFMQFVSRVSVKNLNCKHDYSGLSGYFLTREELWGLTRTHAHTRTRAHSCNDVLTRVKAFAHEDLHSR